MSSHPPEATFVSLIRPVECDQVKVWREIQGGSETRDKRDGAALCARNAAFTGLPLQPSEYGTDKDVQP